MHGGGAQRPDAQRAARRGCRRCRWRPPLPARGGSLGCGGLLARGRACRLRAGSVGARPGSPGRRRPGPACPAARPPRTRRRRVPPARRPWSVVQRPLAGRDDGADRLPQRLRRAEQAAASPGCPSPAATAARSSSRLQVRHRSRSSWWMSRLRGAGSAASRVAAARVPASPAARATRRSPSRNPSRSARARLSVEQRRGAVDRPWYRAIAPRLISAHAIPSASPSSRDQSPARSALGRRRGVVALQPGHEAKVTVRAGDRPPVAGRLRGGQALGVQLHRPGVAALLARHAAEYLQRGRDALLVVQLPVSRSAASSRRTAGT